MPYAANLNTRIYYETYGSTGPWITFINGHTRSSRDFKNIANSMSERGYRCLIFDNRGSGQTESTDTFSLLDIVQDIETIWEQLNIKESWVLGISMGGLIAQTFYEKNSSHIIGLVLVSTARSVQGLSEQAYTPWGETLESIEEKLAPYFSKHFMNNNRLLIKAMAKNIQLEITSNNFLERAESQRKAMAQSAALPLNNTIECPTLILHGSDDRIIFPEHAHHLHKDIKGSKLRILDEKGHLLLAEASKLLVEEIELFLNSRHSSDKGDI